MKRLVAQNKRLLIELQTGEEMPRFKEAVMMPCQEKVSLLERISKEHPGFQGPMEAPWS
jgi:hypothetical protein